MDERSPVAKKAPVTKTVAVAKTAPVKKTVAGTGRGPARRSPMEHPRGRYPRETAALQEIARSCGLVEAIKWGKPCFTLGGKNVALIQPFQRYLALLFFQGALLQDGEGLLHRVGEHMEGPRQMRFGSVEEIEQRRAAIRRYLEQAMDLVRSGARVERREVAELAMPEELRFRLDRDDALRRAFAALTPGRQKGYLFEIARAKQAATRVARVEKHALRILAGRGLND